MYILLVILLIILFKLAQAYNLLQKLAQGVRSSNSKVKASLQKKIELTNKLMDIAKSYGEHEKLIYIKMSNDFNTAYKDSNSAIMALKSLSIQYPELKANQAYIDLSNKLTEIEEDILTRRDSYNDAVERYNTKRSSVPYNLFANSLGFGEAPYFDIDSDEKMNEFKTDDGELLKELLKSTSQKAQDMTKKGMEKVNEKKEELKEKFEKIKEEKQKVEDNEDIEDRVL